MLGLKPHYNFLLKLLLLFSPTSVLVDKFLEVQRDIAAEHDPFERQIHCLFRNKLAGELHHRAVTRKDRLVQLNGNRYQIEPAHVGAIWLRLLDASGEVL
jgi:hypothetical protein